MKILITGANGMLAKAVIKRFKEHELILTDVDELDITNLSEVEDFVKINKPEVIINCAAYTAVDKAESEPELARKINVKGPYNLAVMSNKYGARLVHISTDYVFGGDLDISKSYKEDDSKNPVTVYGKTKLEGEKAITENCNKYYIFRTAWLYGDGKNFVRTMIKAGKERDEVTVVNDQHGSPTYTVDLANVIYEAIEKNIRSGIYHVTNIGFTTWYKFTKEIYSLVDLKCKVRPVTSEEYVTPAKRPKNSQMSKEKILLTEIQIPSVNDALVRYLKEENEIK